MNASPDVLVEDAGLVRVLTLHNPARRNALTADVLRKLQTAIAPTSFRAFILRGEGERAFCSGYDLQSLEPVGEGALPDDLIGEVYAQIEAHPSPFIACLNGAAFGAGFELATACDFRIATGSA
ncbi:MAG: enoyl-CoA hydratase/isomerase family protein, partial [Myxococcaceae bacterium]